MSLCQGAKTKVGVGSELSEECLVQVGAHERSVLPPIVSAIVVDFIISMQEKACWNEILNADNLVVMGESI